ncbi:MAG: hypothetical protein DMG63_15380 [Acidobacteria bacterium]|nr:MAG: hypothetical protein DMG63_15380 [Acidobacteriota bacterium]
MKSMMRKVSGVAILLLASGIPLLGAKDSSFTVPVTGSNGFTGTATINGFVNQGGHIVAVGFVANSARTAFAGVVWQQVTLTADTGGLAAYPGPAPNVAHLTRIAWSPDRQGAKLVPVATSGDCGVVNVNLLGATNVNLAGAQVALDPIGISVSGQSGTPVGTIVCSLLSLVQSVGGIVGSVGNVVNLLNSLLGALTGSLGGLTGA